jgi:hypothetical protein
MLFMWTPMVLGLYISLRRDRLFFQDVILLRNILINIFYYLKKLFLILK